MNNRKVFVVFETLLLLIFITITIILAQRLKFDPQKGFISTAGIRIEGVKNAQVYVNDKKYGQTPLTVDYLTNSSYQVSMTKDGRQNWKTNIPVIPEFISRIFPILFPNDLNRQQALTNITDVYQIKSRQGFFYTKVNTAKNIEIHKYVINQSFFGETADDKTIIELAQSPLILKPSFTGDHLLISYNGLKYAVSTDSTLNSLNKPIDVTSGMDQISWVPNERFLISDDGKQVYTYDISNQQKYTVGLNDASFTYKFLDVDTNKVLLLKTDLSLSADPVIASKKLSLIELNLDGKSPITLDLELPLSGLKKGFMFPNSSYIALEYDTGVKSINTDTKVQNDYEGTVIYTDQLNDVLITKGKTKFVLTDIKNEKSFNTVIQTDNVSDLAPYFKNANIMYLMETGKGKKLISNYIDGNVESELDEGNIIPLINWKKSDYVRIYYAKKNISGMWDINKIEFEN